MYVRRNGQMYECVVVDVNTQHDFCEAGGAFPVANLSEIIPAFRHMVAWERRNLAPVVSSIESHRVAELSDSGNPIHCVDGSNGQQKLAFTLLPCRLRLEADNTLAVPIDLFEQYQQVILRKRTDDLLANPKADRLLTQMSVREYILYGTALEGAVKTVALALLTRGKQVTIVVDACGYWHQARADLTIRQLTAKGASVCTVSDLLRRKLDRSLGYPRRNGSSDGRHEGDNGSSGNGKNGATLSRNGGKANGRNGNGKPGNGRCAGHSNNCGISPIVRSPNGSGENHPDRATSS
jgi:nicotinamidase-related amidase